MKILVTGYSGFLGRNLVPQLQAHGHELILVGRAMVLPSNLTGLSAVVHLAGENIAGGIWTNKRKQKLMSSRVDTTQILMTELVKRRAIPSVFISASAIGFYGDRGDEWCLETDGRGKGFLADIVEKWENAVLGMGPLGTRTCRLRFGMILGKGGALKKMLPPFRFGMGAVLGSGKQWNSWIHVDDAVGIIQHCLANEKCEGIYNACSPNPVLQKDFAKGLARILKRPCLLKIPPSILKWTLGEFSDLFLQSQRVNVKKIIQTGYRFCYHELDGALRRCLT